MFLRSCSATTSRMKHGVYVPGATPHRACPQRDMAPTTGRASALSRSSGEYQEAY
jgi:hypothetical protein